MISANDWDLTPQDRERLKAMWRPVAQPGWQPSPQLGRRHDPIEIVDYDASWPARFQSWRKRLTTALGDAAVSIEHVGSTCVPELPAKPVIDIQVLVPDVENEAAYLPHIESTGVPLHSRSPGHRYFRPGVGQPREVQIHVHAEGSQEAEDRIIFRDHLRTNAAAREAYAQLKRRLATTHPAPLGPLRQQVVRVPHRVITGVLLIHRGVAAQQGRQVNVHIRDQGLPVDDLPIAKVGRHQRQMHQRVPRPQQHGRFKIMM